MKDMGHGLEAKSAVAGFLKEFGAFQDEVKARMRAQDDRLEQIDRKAASVGARPALKQLERQALPLRVDALDEVI